jgi:hypothetical protein
MSLEHYCYASLVHSGPCSLPTVVGVWGGGGACMGCVGCVGSVGSVVCVWCVGCVGGVGVWGHSLRSTFHRLHLLRLWTPTILIVIFFEVKCKHCVSYVYAHMMWKALCLVV